MRISDWSSDVCSSDLREGRFDGHERLLSLLSPRELGGLLLDDEAPLSLPRIEWLLDRGADPEVRTDGGDTPVFALLALGHEALPALRSEERRVGKEGLSTCRSGLSAYREKNKQFIIIRSSTQQTNTNTHPSPPPNQKN